MYDKTTKTKSLASCWYSLWRNMGTTLRTVIVSWHPRNILGWKQGWRWRLSLHRVKRESDVPIFLWGVFVGSLKNHWALQTGGGWPCFSQRSGISQPPVLRSHDILRVELIWFESHNLDSQKWCIEATFFWERGIFFWVGQMRKKTSWRIRMIYNRFFNISYT